MRESTSDKATEAASHSSSENNIPKFDIVYIKPDAPNNGSYREMLSDSVIPVYDALKKHLLDEKRCDKMEFDASYQTAVRFAFSALLEDHPELFWVDEMLDDISIYTDSHGKKKISVVFRELYPGSFDDIEKGWNELAHAVSIIKYARASESRYDTLQAIQAYICDSVSNNRTVSDDYSVYLDSFVAPLLRCGTDEGKLICRGYARSFKAVCNQFDIPCVIIYGQTFDFGHAWNVVLMEDGKWYGADLTNDDGGELSPHYYNYFL